MRVCSIDGCDRKHSSNGYCNMHAMRFYRLGSASAKLITYPDKCSVDGCGDKYKCSGLCSKHFQRLKKHGSLKKEFHDLSAIDRFTKKTKFNPDTGCIDWIGCKIPKGYGQFVSGGVSYRAHRFSYQHYIGEIPDDMFVLHRCDRPSCVNPKHLFLGTNDDNMKDMVNKKRSVHRHGERNPSVKITEEIAIEIKRMLHLDFKQKYIASILNVSIHIVSNIKKGISWSYLFNNKKESL